MEACQRSCWRGRQPRPRLADVCSRLGLRERSLRPRTGRKVESGVQASAQPPQSGTANTAALAIRLRTGATAQQLV
eukprot:178336-Pyramimonas_sp.AAC.1